MSQSENIETSSNGLIFNTSYIPEELLIHILSYVDCMQLVSCHLVCKQWNNIIKKSVWRKKAERACGKLFFTDEKVPWKTYFFVCNKKLFKRNLLTSTDVKVYYDSYDADEDTFETIQVNVKDNNPPINILPLPEDLEFQENINCTKVNYNSITNAKRKFVIDLIQEGFTEYILDNLQPTIEVSEWYYTAQEEEKAEYVSSIKLLYGNHVDYDSKVMRVYHFHKKLDHAEKQGKWFKFTHVIKNYGSGLRSIKFYDGGNNNIIMAEASVMMTVPSRKNVTDSNKI